MENLNERCCGFLGGGLLNVLIVPTTQLIDTFILGLVGGLAGLLAREIVNYIKNKLIK